MNMFKKNGGFTLVELIVVIAILAILASIAVPAYSGYLNKANAVQGQIDAAAQDRAIKAAFAENGVVYDATLVQISSNGTVTIANSVAEAADIIASYNVFMGGSVSASTPTDPTE